MILVDMSWRQSMSVGVQGLIEKLLEFELKSSILLFTDEVRPPRWVCLPYVVVLYWVGRLLTNLFSSSLNNMGGTAHEKS